MGYLETGMRVLDSASGLLSRCRLAVLGANDTNTDADNNAINGSGSDDEFHRLMSTSTTRAKHLCGYSRWRVCLHGGS